MRLALIILCLFGILVCCAAEAKAYPQLSKKQEKIAKRGLPHAVQKYAHVVNRYWSKYLWKDGHRRLSVRALRNALCVIWWESNGRRYCKTGVHCGIFQIRRDHFRGRNPWRIVSQAATSGMLYARLGWRPWAQTAYRGVP